MRIAYLAPANSVHSHRWIRWFATNGHGIKWISAHPLVGEPLPGVSLTILPQGRRTPLRMLQWLRGVRRELRAAAPDCVHVHSLGTYALLALAVPAGIPIVATPWGSDLITDLATPWRRAIVRRAVQRARLYTCDAEHMRPRLVALGADRAKVHLVNFGIEADRYAAAAERRRARPARRVGSHEPLRVVSLRNLDPVYDHPTLLRAVSRLHGDGVPVLVKLYGHGPELPRLQSLAADLGVTALVEFCGRYSQATLPDMLERMDVYVSTSTSDAGLAASTAEAMAAGLPVVVSESGDNRSWIAHGINGRLFAVGDDQALARELAGMARDAAASQRLGDAGRETILARNDYATEMRKMEALYESALT
jgi:glycosyltransferase involved in cell wall biosynthesis